MAGFIFSISNKEGKEGVKKRVFDGDYAALVPEDLSSLKGKQVAISVLADYCSMKAGDNVYFLSNRCIYGVGKLINIGEDCKYKNYLRAHEIKEIKLTERDKVLKESNPCARWICFFEPDTKFYSQGVDMDEVLKYRPASFRMLRAFQDRSFIKIDDEENRALKEYIYLKNRNKNETMKHSDKEHKRIMTFDLNQYRIKVQETIKDMYSVETGEVNFEMLLEAYLIDLIQKGEFEGVSYDYVTHQVIASPFKPIAYIDKMDIFAYKYLWNYPDPIKPIEKYLIIELKKGKANEDTLLQVMRYVDWVSQEYASGNYSLIKAVVVAKDYVKGIDLVLREQCTRSYISNIHPNETDTWNDIKVMDYKVDNEGNIKIEEFDTFNVVSNLKEKIGSLGMNISKNPITINKKTINPVIKIQNKKVAIFNKINEEDKKLLENKNWRVYTTETIKNIDDVSKLINRIIN